MRHPGGQMGLPRWTRSLSTRLPAVDRPKLGLSLGFKLLPNNFPLKILPASFQLGTLRKPFIIHG